MSQVPVYFVLSLPLVGAFALFALGVVVIFRASRVLNLAHGAMAMVPPFLLFELSRHGIPLAAGLPLALASGALIGIGVERVFVRVLRRQGSTGQTVGTVAALGLLVALATKIWGTTPRSAVALFPVGGVKVGASLLSWGHIGLISVALAATAATFVLFRFTDLGLAMRLAADNRRAASLMGIDPDTTTMVAWALGGTLAAVAGILLAGVTTLHPINLALLVLPAFVAALVGGMETLLGALIGAAIVGLTQGMVPAMALVPGLKSLATQVGAPQLVLTILAFIVMVFRGSRFSGSDVGAEPERAAHGLDAQAPIVRGRATRRRTTGQTLLAAGLLTLPFVAPFSLVGTANNALIISLVAASLVLLTGWVGQISLAQATFVGIGAFATAAFARETGVGFPASLPLAVAATSAAAAVLGVVALRVRGLYLAVATLIFVWMSSEYLFSASWLVGSGGSASLKRQTIGIPGTVPFFDLAERRTFYFVALAFVALTFWGLSNLRDSKIGRALFAVHGSEMAAASLGIDVTRYKIFAFAVSGAIAGAAGNLLIVSQGTSTPGQFSFVRSLFFLSVAVVGGLTSLGGAVTAAVVFALLDELFFRVSALAGWLEVVSAGLLAVVLLARPGGLASLEPLLRAVGRAFAWRMTTLRRGARLRFVSRVRLPAQLTRRRAARRRVADEIVTTAVRASEIGRRNVSEISSAGDRSSRIPVLAIEGVTVRFGGLLAVDAVSLHVCEGEIVGLIGPNGAGKTTIFNAISGLNVPAAGVVRLFGRDVTAYPVHRRAAAGLARTFQVIQLFPRLTVFENLLVATHLQNPSGPGASLAVSRRALEAEAAARARVAAMVELIDLGEIAHRPVAGLSFGLLRRVELARSLVTGARLVMLDEPASGLDSAETRRMTQFLSFVNSELGVTILLVEHDVAMVTGVSDHIYVLDRGRLIAEGPPAEVQRNDEVVTAYLGSAGHSEVPA